MNENGQDKVVAFDLLFTNRHIQMLKVFMPYFDRSIQKSLAIYIKFLELQYTIDFFRKYSNASLDKLPCEHSFNITKLCGEMLPYCDDQEKASLENMRNMFQTFAGFKEMMEMMQMMKEMFPEGETPLNPMGAMELMGSMGMSDLDPSKMFEMFQAMSGIGGESDGNRQNEPSDMDGG